jgi:cytochrome c556
MSTRRNRMKRLPPSLVASVAALAVMVTALPAAAQFAKPEDAIKYRRSAMFLEMTHLGRIFAMANGRVPFDAKVAAENAEVLAAVSKWQFTGFVEGSDKGDTKAKPEIWTEMDKFREKAGKSQEDVVRLNAAVKTGNVDAIKTAAGAVGQSCKACHDSYRKD